MTAPQPASPRDSSPAKRDTAKLHSEAERRWKRVEHDHPELTETIAFGRGLVALYIDEIPASGATALTPEQAREKLAAGIPLLEGEELDLDLPGLQRFFARLCELASQQPEMPAAERLAAAIAVGSCEVEVLLTFALAEDTTALDKIAATLAVDPTQLQTLTGFLVSAALMGAAHAYGPLLREAQIPWEAGGCPICGGPPLLAEMQGSSGERQLRCAACGTGWRTLVNRCAHCGTTEGKALRYLAVEGREEKYRADLCDRCRGYLKSITSFAPTPAELLTIEDATTLYLDAAARERGYTATPEIDG
ncbi:MAG TPA: formate dehydrogenase accessory protein FdhE [Thermomicrobiales bacterium]|jgi:FdhE protein